MNGVTNKQDISILQSNYLQLRIRFKIIQLSISIVHQQLFWEAIISTV
jgi:hypothetical protein